MQIQQIIHVLKAIRERKGISKQEVARRMGLKDVGSITSIEGGNPTLASLKRYAEALSLSITLEVQGMRVITFYNHAGGIGKSSSVRDVGFVLSQMGYKVLLIDADPQANLSSWLGVDPYSIANEQTILDAVQLRGRKPGELKLPKPILTYGLHLIPCTLDVSQLEQSLPSDGYWIMRLRNVLRGLDQYDFVLIDPPPSMGVIAKLAITAADHLVVVLPTNDKGVRSLQTVFLTIEACREANPDLDIAMFLLTQHDPRTLADKSSLEAFKDLADVAPLSSPLHNRPGPYKRASGASMPIPLLPAKEAADAIKEIEQAVAELLDATGVKVAVS